MSDMTKYHALISTSSMQRLEPLYEHICAYESSIAAYEYDPVKAPCQMDPLLLKRVFEPAIFNDALFFDLFASMSMEAERAIGGLFRVYIDGMLSPQYENEVLFNQPNVGETFKECVSRATGGRKFGIIVNGAEQWSDQLARMGARIFAPIVEAQGTWRSTVEVTLFIGNYGYTPFGIHIDDPYTSVIHFHTGPTAKEMTLFSREEFHRLNGERKNCFQPDRLVPYGKTFVIEAGDVFLLPPHWYHIGNTDGFSIGVAFAVSKYPAAKVTESILQHAITEERLRGSIDEVVKRAEKDEYSQAEWLRRIHAESMVRALSRRHLRYSFVRFQDDVMTPDTRLIRDPDFPLTTIEVDEDLLVFARGNRIRFARNEVCIRLMKVIPDTPFCARDLYEKLDGGVSLDALLTTVGQLRRLGGLQLAA
ncbi:cupin domain-containing protein [Photorhabdus sp. CRCIA-P01]|uniref:cupin domain-containing protein n=1 Tax=Photorhabdus sp. CRCIA-P01 TaxID=2019570 RepID=UPI000E59BA3A|nr:cupin domain-containing protein [Photorhabdus sp. CRCIA-P01]